MPFGSYGMITATSNDITWPTTLYLSLTALLPSDVRCKDI